MCCDLTFRSFKIDKSELLVGCQQGWHFSVLHERHHQSLFTEKQQQQ